MGDEGRRVLDEPNIEKVKVTIDIEVFQKLVLAIPSSVYEITESLMLLLAKT